MAFASTEVRRFETGKDRGPEGQANSALTWFSRDYKECGTVFQNDPHTRSHSRTVWLLSEEASAQSDALSRVRTSASDDPDREEGDVTDSPTRAQPVERVGTPEGPE